MDSFWVYEETKVIVVSEGSATIWATKGTKVVVVSERWARIWALCRK
jgi:hypothetical protein